MNHGPSSRSSHYGYSAHGRGYASEAQAQWNGVKKQVVELGDPHHLLTPTEPSALREHLRDTSERVVSGIQELSEEEAARTKEMIQLVTRCAARLAPKTSFYAVLTCLLDSKVPQFGSKVCAETIAVLQQDLTFLYHDEDEDENEEEEEDPNTAVDEDDDAEMETRERPKDPFRQKKDLTSIFLRIKLLVRFLGELVSTRILQAEEMLRTLDTLQSVCTPEDINNEEDVRKQQNAAAFKDYFAFVVLDTLLVCGSSLSKNCEDIYESLLSRCEGYISNRETEPTRQGMEGDRANWIAERTQLNLIYEPETKEDLTVLYKQIDPLSSLWHALNRIRKEVQEAQGNEQEKEGDQASKELRWVIPGTPYPQSQFINLIRCTEPTVPAHQISLDASKFDQAKLPNYFPYFRILDEESGPVGAAIAKLHSATYIIARENIRNTLEAFKDKPSEASKQLLGLCRTLNARLNVKTGESDDASKIYTEYLLVETMLVEILSSNSKAHNAYYCSVIYNLVKTDPKMVSPPLAIIVELLFREIPSMNTFAFDSFVRFFSLFLSNFEFKWPWSNWSHVLEAEEDDPQRLFVSTVIERCVRLSYLQFMQKLLPVEFHMLLPPNPVHYLRFSMTASSEEEESSSVSPESRELYSDVVAKVKARASSDEVLEAIMTGIKESRVSKSEGVEIFTTSILEAGAATFTHLRSLLDKYRELFLKLIDGDETIEIEIVNTIASVWQNSPQHVTIVTSLFLQYRAINCVAAAKWVFGPEAAQQYSWPYVWEVLDESVEFLLTTQKQAQIAFEKEEKSDHHGHAEDYVRRKQDVEKASDRLKEILLVSFEGFVNIISEHKANCDADGVPYQDNWYKSALARMKSFGKKYRVPMEAVLAELSAKVFTSELTDNDLSSLYQLIKNAYQSV